MCSRKWDEIKYSHVPSKAMHNYQKAFLKHDEIQFKKYLSDVKEGKTKINSGVLFPHEILGKYISVWYDIEDEISELLLHMDVVLVNWCFTHNYRNKRTI